MSAPSHNPAGAYGSVPEPSHNLAERGYGSAAASRADLELPTTGPAATDFAHEGRPSTTLDGGYAATNSGDTAVEDEAGLDRSGSVASTYPGGAVSRSNTLKKKNSVSRKTSIKRSGSRKSFVGAGEIKSAVAGDADPQDREYNSAFHTPIPTSSSPTEILANRFQSWRTYLKSLITYFKEIQTSYDHRAKTIMKVSNVISNTQAPTMLMSEGGLNEATRILNDYHKHSLNEANKSRDIEIDVIQALNGLRADLGAKIKEIKGLSGDFKNSVDKERESTRKSVSELQDAIQHYDHEDSNDKGKSDPYLVRLSVDRSIERQIDEENYLHRAYLNLENSGRELEGIVVGEIQKAFNAIAGILRREGDDAYNTVEHLRAGPISIQKDLEWNSFVRSDPHFVDPSLPVRRVQDIYYPGRDHPAATEIRAGMLERKSKYLKSYSPGWYVLSPTHLHEFKSADNIYSQPPIMSLYLGDQKLGSHSGPESNSHKFMLKGRQSGGMHRGHSWVFRAESYETMLAWYEAIQILTEKTGAERHAFVRQHARTTSGPQRAHSVSSDGFDDDEADQVPYAASTTNQQVVPVLLEARPQRPQPGGRFPSDINLARDRAMSDNSSDHEPENAIARVAAAPVVAMTGDGAINNREAIDPVERPMVASNEADPYHLHGVASHADERRPAQNAASDDILDEPAVMPPVIGRTFSEQKYDPAAETEISHRVPDLTGSARRDDRSVEPQAPTTYPDRSVSDAPVNSNAVPTQTFVLPIQPEAPMNQVQQPAGSGYNIYQPEPSSSSQPAENRPAPAPQVMRNQSSYGDWMAPAAGGAAVGALGEGAYQRYEQQLQEQPQQFEPIAVSTPRGPTYHIDANDFVYPARSSVETEPSQYSTQRMAPTSFNGSNSNGTNSNTESLGGLENKGAHPTGHMFPSVVRHDTDMSVSKLHIPGEFPKTPGATSSTGGSAATGPSAWEAARE